MRRTLYIALPSTVPRKSMNNNKEIPQKRGSPHEPWRLHGEAYRGKAVPLPPLKLTERIGASLLNSDAFFLPFEQTKLL